MTMAMDEQDPYAWIIKFCKPTDSQEAKFPNCPFARESENFMDSNPSQFSSLTPFFYLTQSDPGEIVVVSLPGSSSSGDQSMLEEDAVFHTPPEHHSHSHLSSSDDQNPNELCAEVLRVAEAGSDRTTKFRVSEAGLDDEPGTKRVRVVAGEEYDGDTVPLGETEVVEIEEDEVVHNTEVIVLSDSDGEERAEGSLDEEVGGLMKDSVAITELGEKIEYAKDIGVPRGENRDSSGSLESGKIERIGGFEKAVEDAKMPKDSHGDEGVKTSGKIERIGGFEKAVKDAKMPKDSSHGDGGVKTSGKRIEELRNADGGCEGRRERAVGRGRQLPPLLKGGGKDVVESLGKKSGLLGMMDELRAVFGDTDGGCEDDVDFIETAKRKGMTFPKPRWWP